MVSIITPVYNSKKYIVQCIESVLAQTHTNWEHILVDDCSTDDSTKIIQIYAQKDQRIKYYKLEKNSGAGVARNKAIGIAKGRFIAFLDSDDFWSKEKLEKQLKFLKQTGQAIVYSQYFIYDDVLKKSSLLVKSPSKTSFKKMQKNDYIGFLTLLFDTHQVGKPLMPTIRRRQDWAYKLILLKKDVEAQCVPEPLAYYRIGNQSLSSSKLKLIKYNFKVFREVLGYPWLKSFFKMGVFLMHYFIFKLTSRKKVG